MRKITYIHHSGFTVEYDQVIFIFDYYKGQLPEWSKDQQKKFYIFTSHQHNDHFNMQLFQYMEDYHDVTWFFPKEMKFSSAFLKRNGVKEKWREHMIFLPKEGIETVTGLEIETFRSTDEGVAFLIKWQEQVIYHSGDLNWWHWKEESESYNQKMEKDFKKEIDKMAGMKIDLAFLPLDPRLGESYYWGLDYFMKTTNTEIVFPMHFWGKYSVCKHLLELPEATGYIDRVKVITQTFQQFESQI